MSRQQKQVFMAGEGDAFYTRNQSVLTGDERIAAGDPLLPFLAEMKPFPARVLEIGCANGWRLNRLRALGATACHGIDPSQAAITQGAQDYPALHLRVGTAESLPFADAAFDLVVFGFCLYLCDPGDHFRIAAEADRVLADGGALVIYDFDPPQPYRNPYAHQPGVHAYKMDFSRLFLAHPHYTLRDKRSAAHGPAGRANPDDRLGLHWLVKDAATAWPLNPWKREQPV